MGPYRIILSLGRGLYHLEEVNNPSQVVSRVNGVHLKLYVSAPVSSESELLILIIKLKHLLIFIFTYNRLK